MSEMEAPVWEVPGVVEMMLAVPGLFIPYRREGNDVETVVPTPFEDTTQFFTSRLGTSGEVYGVHACEWVVGGGMTVYVRRMVSMRPGSSYTKIRLEDAPQDVVDKLTVWERW